MGPYSAAHPQYLFLPEYPPLGTQHLPSTVILTSCNHTRAPLFTGVNSPVKTRLQISARPPSIRFQLLASRVVKQDRVVTIVSDLLRTLGRVICESSQLGQRGAPVVYVKEGTTRVFVIQHQVAAREVVGHFCSSTCISFWKQYSVQNK